jgi:ABC-2 type transport system permease protein
MAAVSSLVLKSIYHCSNTRRLIHAQSSFKILFIVCFALLFEIGLFWIFIDGFEYLSRMGGIGLIIINKLFTVFFLGMGLMLAASGIVSSYSTIYRSDEIPFLLTRPFTTSQIVLYKFFESTGLSSWAFFFIIIPFVGAYGYHEKITPVFALWNLLFSLPFLLLCSGIGTILTMILVRWVPVGKQLRLIGMLVAVTGLWFIAHEIRTSNQYMTSEGDINLAILLPGFSLASNPLLPSWWVSEGISAFSNNQWLRGTMFWIMTTSTAMMICLLIEWLGARIFYNGWQRLTGSSACNHRAPLMLQSLQRALSFMPHDIRAIVMKDIRIFLRDPIQWSQVLIFFGLLALYFSNLRTFKYHTFPDNWRNTIAFLNVFSVSAVICSLGSRFIFPQLSLEGQGFWFLGLSPAKMSRILLTKFFMALTGMLTISIGLMLLSSRMLNATPAVSVIAIFLSCATSCAVCGLSTGLGAIYIDLNQKNPAAIVSGFGGTMNLVLSLGFMLSSILPFGMIFHLNLLGRINSSEMITSLILAGLWLTALTIATTVIPLYIGHKSLRTREY